MPIIFLAGCCYTYFGYPWAGSVKQKERIPVAEACFFPESGCCKVLLLFSDCFFPSLFSPRVLSLSQVFVEVMRLLLFCLFRKGLHFVAPSSSQTSSGPSSNGVAGVYDVANLILRILPSEDGVVLRKLIMTAVSAFILLNAHYLNYSYQCSWSLKSV